MMRSITYKSAVAVALLAAFLLFWVIGAVGIIGASGDRADLLYLGVFAVAIIGAVVSRLRAHGMAQVMVATAFTQALVAIIALAAGLVPAYNPAYEILGINGFFVALFAASAWLFRRAALGHPEYANQP